MSIDYSACYLTIEIGTRTRVSIYNEMRAFLIAEIEKRGFSATDPALFKMLTIEVEAQHLTDTVIRDLEHHCRDDLDTVVELGMFSTHIGEIAPEIIEDVKNEFLQHPLAGLDFLIEMASGTPIAIDGSDFVLMHGQAPEIDE